MGEADGRGREATDSMPPMVAMTARKWVLLIFGMWIPPMMADWIPSRNQSNGTEGTGKALGARGEADVGAMVARSRGQAGRFNSPVLGSPSCPSRVPRSVQRPGVTARQLG